MVVVIVVVVGVDVSFWFIGEVVWFVVLGCVE